MLWRLLGVRIGRRVFDDGCVLTERTFVTIGDDCTLNVGSVIQCHSQEDGAFKSDRIVIGAGCTLGVGAFVHYGVTMGDGAVLAADSFLMKGEEMPPSALWGGNPAKKMREHSADMQVRRISTADGAVLVRGVTPGHPGIDDAKGTSMDARSRPAGSSGRPCCAGGATAIPRWTLDPVPGVAEHAGPLADDLAAALAGWPTSWAAAALVCWPRTRRCWRRCPASRGGDRLPAGPAGGRCPAG